MKTADVALLVLIAFVAGFAIGIYADLTLGKLRDYLDPPSYFVPI